MMYSHIQDYIKPPCPTTLSGLVYINTDDCVCTHNSHPLGDYVSHEAIVKDNLREIVTNHFISAYSDGTVRHISGNLYNVSTKVFLELIEQGYMVVDGRIDADFLLTRNTYIGSPRFDIPHVMPVTTQPSLEFDAEKSPFNNLSSITRLGKERKLWFGDEQHEIFFMNDYNLILVKKEKPSSYIVHDVFPDDSDYVLIRKQKIDIGYHDMLQRIVDNSDRLSFNDDGTKILLTFHDILGDYNDICFAPNGSLFFGEHVSEDYCDIDKLPDEVVMEALKQINKDVKLLRLKKVHSQNSDPRMVSYMFSYLNDFSMVKEWVKHAI